MFLLWPAGFETVLYDHPINFRSADRFFFRPWTSFSPPILHLTFSIYHAPLMPSSLDQFAHVLSGQSRSLSARAVRAVTAVAEPGYATMMRLRNQLYDRNLLRSNSLGRPAISIGNLTAGGTGKTPVVRWLADTMRRRGRHPAVLLRGYMRRPRSEAAAEDGRDARRFHSDEAAMLRDQLNRPGQSTIEIEPNPDRLAGAAAVLTRSPHTDLFILDDAFQHRRARRDFDLVLIDATEPFGFRHVHPRGLLREPMAGLRRADAFLLTRVDAVKSNPLQSISDTLHRWNPDAPIYQSAHHHAGLIGDDGDVQSLDLLGKTPFFAFSGIGRPAPLHRQLEQWGANYVGHHWFDDHHPYAEADVRDLIAEAQSHGATALVTTEKDWVKLVPLRALWKEAQLSLWRLNLTIRFIDDHEDRLVKQIEAAL